MAAVVALTAVAAVVDMVAAVAATAAAITRATTAAVAMAAVATTAAGTMATAVLGRTGVRFMLTWCDGADAMYVAAGQHATCKAGLQANVQIDVAARMHVCGCFVMLGL